MGKLDIDVAEVKKLVELVETHGLEELTVEEGELSITVRGRASLSGARAAAHAETGNLVQEMRGAQEEELVEEEIDLVPEEEPEGNIVDIVAPLVGVFYRSPAPDAPVFVEVGDVIEVGAEVGLIEAMKVFSPIPSEVAGEIVAIPTEGGKLVSEGDVLVRVRVDEEQS